MEVKIFEGGLYPHEVTAIEKIKTAFSRKGGMFPWKGYAGFTFADSRDNEGEFDLVIVTHCNVIIVELKEWNNQPITSVDQRWFKGDQDMKKSPVLVTKQKVFTLKNKLERYKNRFTNKGFIPYITYYVVMTGTSDFSQLTGLDAERTISLDDFLKIANQNEFNKHFQTKHPNQRTVNQDFDIFDELFLGNQTRARSLNFGGYTMQNVLFEHPNQIYKEYYAVTKGQFKSEALLRWWDFSKINGVKALTPTGRGDIVSRERNVLQFLKNHDQELYNHCLRSLSHYDPDEVTSVSAELFELPSNHMRFNEFVGKYANIYSQADRLTFAKILLAQFAALHKAKVAHRDINAHSLWLSQSKTVVISNLACAYFKPIGTVDDYREQLSVGAIDAMDHDANDTTKTPFESDVKALAIMLWHLLSGQRISEDSLRSLQDDLQSSDAFYAPVLLNAIFANLYQDADGLLSGIIDAEPKRAEIPTFDVRLLDPYRHAINHSRQYVVSNDMDYFVDTDEKEVYCSNGHIVKAWLHAGGINTSEIESFQVHKFLKKIEKLKAINSNYIPKIESFGIAQKSSSLYMVSEYIENATSWREKYAVIDGELNPFDQDHRLNDIQMLLNAIGELHEAHISHGDLHDGNILFDANNEHLYLIDIPDFNLSGEESRNTQYAPERYDVDAYQRDNYALMKLACEILDIEFGEDSDHFPEIAKAIQTELKDEEFGFKSFTRFKQAFDKRNDPGKSIFTVYDDRISEDFTIYPENNKTYFVITPRRESNNIITSIQIFGVGGCYTLQYGESYDGTMNIFGGSSPKPQNSIPAFARKNYQLTLDVEIQVKASDRKSHYELSSSLEAQEDFIEELDLILDEYSNKQAKAETESSETDEADEDADDIITNVLEELVQGEYAPIQTKLLWEAILHAEMDAAPSIELTENATFNGSEFICVHDSEIDPLESFDDSDSDQIYAYILKADNKARQDDSVATKYVTEYKVGEVNLSASTLKEVRITRVNPKHPPKEGDTILFRSMQSNASLRKRKNAIERIINENSVIPNLVSLFDEDNNEVSTNYDIEVTPNDFARYDRIDDHGHKISLNPQQREAFQHIINNGPLSLLQGPPGTGKTEFISAFVHYLIEKQNVKNILLVSQSHEAVNNAAERIRKHCTRLGTPLDIVRFSNRESTVSEGLKDVYSKAITTEKRELFLAEIESRVSSLATALGIQPKAMITVVELQLRLFKQMNDLESLKKTLTLIQKDAESNDNDLSDFGLKEQIQMLETSIRMEVKDSFDLCVDKETPLNYLLRERILNVVRQRFGLTANEIDKVKDLAVVTSSMLDTLSGDYVNYDEFYARSRQLVVGTCVGIGQGHINIRDNIYDWVIIDEAARSQSGELAIAMQSGKRVLLVGDHHQLPPNYSQEQKAEVARKLRHSYGRLDHDELDELLKSDFERAFRSPYGAQASASLLTQYRMATPIGNMVSDIFYDGKLKSAGRIVSGCYGQNVDVLSSSVTWIDTSDQGRHAYHTDADRNGKLFNMVEAKAIITMLKQISKDTALIDHLNEVRKVDPAIGIICMYAEQKRRIQRLFNQNQWPEGFKSLVKIDTVDSYQGKENRIIIISITRSDSNNTPGFMKLPNRINVALSRAMDRLIIVGNKNVWTGRNSVLPFGQVVSYMQSYGEDAGYSFVSSKKLKGGAA